MTELTLVEYLKMRRAVETASPILVEKAEELAKRVKERGLPTIELMWDALIAEAEKEQGFLFEVK